MWFIFLIAWLFICLVAYLLLFGGRHCREKLWKYIHTWDGAFLPAEKLCFPSNRELGRLKYTIALVQFQKWDSWRLSVCLRASLLQLLSLTISFLAVLTFGAGYFSVVGSLLSVLEYAVVCLASDHELWVETLPYPNHCIAAAKNVCGHYWSVCLGTVILFENYWSKSEFIWSLLDRPWSPVFIPLFCETVRRN